MKWLTNLFTKTKNEVTNVFPFQPKEKFPCKNCIIYPSGCTELCDKVEMDNKKLMELFLKYNACPDCGSESFHEGPSGGMSQNVTCAGCKHRFNLALPVFIERI